MNPKVLKFCAWSGVICLVVMGIGFVGLAGFVPPPSPHKSALQTAKFFIDNKDSIRFGMILSMVAASFLAPFAVAITLQMRRIEGPHSALAFTQLALGSIFVLEFIYLIFFWQAATFRTDRAPEIIETLNDMAWIPFVGLSSTLVMQSAVFGVAILMDRRPRTIFPRGLGYFNIWAATMFVPGTFNVFFKTGPLAWNGFIAFYLPVAVFVAWLIVNSVMLSRAVDHQVEEERSAAAVAVPASNGDAHDPAAMAAEIASLRRELERVAARVG